MNYEDEDSAWVVNIYERGSVISIGPFAQKIDAFRFVKEEISSGNPQALKSDVRKLIPPDEIFINKPSK